MSIIGALGGIVGGIADKIFGDSAADKQADLQREFAQNGIRWKVRDAEKAGIHPLYALGAQTTAYSPVSVGATDFATGGQNLGSAIGAMTTPKEKQGAFAKTVEGLTLTKMGLENDLLASQIRMINQPGRGPGMPSGRTIDGQGNTMATGGQTVLTVNAKNTPAEDAESQYGEIVGEVFGIGNLLNDLYRTYGPELKKIDPAAIGDALLEILGPRRNDYIDPNQSLKKAMGL